MAMPAARTKKPAGAVELERIQDETIIIPIVGLTSVIPHQWAEKAKKLMRDKQYGLTQPGKREAKDPDEDAEAAMYRLADGRPGIPATAFKGAMVAACRFFEGIPMTEGRLMIFVRGEGADQLVPLAGTEMVREDMPRNATGVVDLRYRTALLAGVDNVEPWRADIEVVYPPRLISKTSIIALLDAAGRVGVGDWRPGSPKSNTGTFGTFRIDDEKEIVEVKS
jgi:hypothetical protein